MKELALRLIRSLADSPDHVSVQESERNGIVTLRVTMQESDKGKVIGKQGKVIKAIRSIVSVAASKTGKKSSVEID